MSFGNSERKSAALRVMSPSLVMLMLFLHLEALSSIHRSCGACGMWRRIRAWPLRLFGLACGQSSRCTCRHQVRDSRADLCQVSSACNLESGLELKPVHVPSFLSPSFSCCVSYIIPFIMSRGWFMMRRSRARGILCLGRNDYVERWE